MKTAAIICEYNPFHFGHNYQIQKLRELIGEDTVVIAIMSGAFTQRGEPAIFDKFLRARAALRVPNKAENADHTETFSVSADSGFADLVLELPAPWSMSGAEFFARAGVEIAVRLGVDHLVFGGESDLEELKKIADNLNSDIFRNGFVEARSNDSSSSTNSLREKIYRKLYDSPPFRGSNDILAVEYLRALSAYSQSARESESALCASKIADAIAADSNIIEPICIKRVGEKYNPDGEFLSDSLIFSSASTIRESIFCGRFTADLLPSSAYAILKNAAVHRMSNLDQAVTAYLRLGSRQMSGVEVSGGIENKLRRAARSNFSIESIVSAAVERRFSASRIKRAIFCAMCGFSAEEHDALPEYTQLLAANERGREFLSTSRKRLGSFILTKSADYRRLPVTAKRQFEANLRSEELWALSSDIPKTRRADELMRRNPFII